MSSNYISEFFTSMKMNFKSFHLKNTPFIIEKITNDLFINREYGYVFIIDDIITCVGKLCSSKIKPLTFEEQTILNKSFYIDYKYDESGNSEIQNLIGESDYCDSYILSVNGKRSYTLTKLDKPNKNMNDYFLDGQVVRHVFLEETWTAIYNKSDDSLRCNKFRYESPTHFSKSHMQHHIGDMTAFVNGWKLCETMVGDTWVVIDEIKPKK